MAVARYPVKSLAKALRLLDTLGKSNNGAGIASLSGELKLGKSTVHRMLATLREFDLAWFDPETCNYSLGPRVLRWSEMLERQNLAIRYGLPILRGLVERCGESATLAVLEGRDVVSIARCESNHRLRVNDVLGGRTPSHCTALGKVLLSPLSEAAFRALYDDSEPLKAVTPNSITSAQKLWEHLTKVRHDRVAYDFEENIIGGICLAAAVYNHNGRAVAAMSLSLPTQRLRGDILITLKEHLLEAAARLSAELGHAPEGRADVATA